MLSFPKNIIYLWSFFIGFSALTSCDRLYSNNLLGESQVTLSSDLSTEYEISMYADSINAVLPLCEKKISMVYTLGNYSFRVNKYTHNGQTVLYAEQGDNGEYENIERNYYIKNNKPVLLIERSVTANYTQSLQYARTYFKQGKVFSTEHKSEFNKVEFQNAHLKKAELEFSDHYLLIAIYEDALNQRNRFDLVFNEIAECPKAKYLILSKREISSYRAPIKVEVEDDFIHELCSNPLRYRGKKLDIHWNTNDNNEAVYSKGKLKCQN